MKADFCVMETYSTFVVNHEFFLQNDKVAINAVQGSPTVELLLR
jgi:hypothetical protein